MYKGQRIGVIVPAFNEEELIEETLTGMPDFIDAIWVVNDGSRDRTLDLVKGRRDIDSRIIIINHEENRGLGQSLIDGYMASRNSAVQITVVMAGDNQMDPDDLPRLLQAIIEEKADYVKGNRLLHPDINCMPRYRFVGNAVLTLLTKFATGYYRLMDPECGYTAIRNSVLSSIPIETITKGYGCNADILCMLNILGFAVTDVQVRPVYGSEKSSIVLWKYVPQASWLLIRLFLRRMWRRYVVIDFHPLVLFFLAGAFNIAFIIVPVSLMFLYLFFKEGQAEPTTLVILAFTIMTTVQLLLLALWMDMDYNKDKRRG